MPLPRSLAVAVIGALAATFSVAVFAAKDCFVARKPHGWVRVCQEAPEWVSWNTDLDAEYDCSAGPCRYCGSCHTSTMKAPPSFSVGKHIASYPYSLKIGQRIAWGGSGSYLANVNGKLCIVADGKSLHCFPSGAVIGRDATGSPRIVLTPPPTTLAPAISR